MKKQGDEYLQRMGYMPSYKFPKKTGEDDEFEYFRVRVPRQYIKEHIETGNKWPHDVDTSIVGTQDVSVVLGVIFLPVYTGVEYLEEDDDFLYYKVRVPKVFLDAHMGESELTYRLLYESKSLTLETEEQKAERESIDTQRERTPKAGESMPNKEELTAVRKVKEDKVLLYEVIFKCKEEDCGMIFTEVGSDLFDMLYSRSCSECGGTRLETIGCKSLVEEDVNG